MRGKQRAFQANATSYLTAALLAVPIGALAWLVMLYLMFGFTRNDAPTAAALACALMAFGGAFGWPLIGARRPARVVQRSCRLCVIVAAMLPVVAFGVLMLWEAAAERPPLGMGGLMLYAIPVIALVVAAVVAGVCWLGAWLAGRRLRDEAHEAASPPDTADA